MTRCPFVVALRDLARRDLASRAVAPIALLLALLLPAAAGAQGLTRPWLEWRTVRTRHFDVHYPARMAEWAEETIARLDAVHAAVAAVVGSVPGERVTVVIEDPANLSNGFALPFLGTPTTFLFATPPDPSSHISANRGWGEILSVHEFAHLAHLTRPSRNPRDALLWRLSPVRVGPVARRSPRWLIEGYATYVEGRLTGTGRPQSAGRAAVLRQWALEGKLPTYGALNGTRDFQQGTMAYLTGSAFLEWLVARKGEESLVHLWRRMTARQDRSFDDAFAGVFGDLPADLYGRFTVELTARALDVERLLDSAGMHPGEEVQRLSWYTGRPAVSRDGARIAVPLTFRDAPGRLVVWKTEADTVTDKERAARAKALARDPQDVQAIEWRPRGRKPVATLRAFHGASYVSPRWHADGERLLVVRQEGRGDGTVRPELFEWNTRSGRLRRVTRGEAIRWADPAPDGRSAVGTRCREGLCDLVRIELASGKVTLVHRGGPRTVFSTPRYSPDGRAVAVTVQRGDTVRVALTDDRGAPLRFAGPADGARRYDASWAADGRSLYLLSEAGGIPNVERIPLDGGAATTLSRVTGAAVAVAPNDAKREAYYLAMETRGFNLYRVALDSAARGPLVRIPPSLAPAAPRGVFAADTFAAAATVASRPYGTGPRRFRVLPIVAAGADGWAPGLALASLDPVGRLGVTLQGAWADRAAWEGGALSLAWRGWRPVVEAEAFALRQSPGDARDAVPGIEALDTRWNGGRLGLTLERPFGWRSHRYRLGASYGRLEPEALDRSPTRQLAYATQASSYRLVTRKTLGVDARIGLHGSAGTTDDEDWRRGVASAGLGLRLGDVAVTGEATAGFVNRDAPGFEQLLVGGGAPVLVDEVLLSQRLTMPALPPGTLAGPQAATVRFAIPGMIEPFWWASTAGTSFDGAWLRVVGVEARGSFGTLAGPMLAGLPGVSIRAGLAYPLDGALEERLRAYFTMRWMP